MKARWVVKDKLTGEYLSDLRVFKQFGRAWIDHEWSKDRKDALRFIEIISAAGCIDAIAQHDDIRVFRLRPVRR